MDLSKLDVWEIAEIPEVCNDGEADEIGEDSEDSLSADSSDYCEGSTVVDQDVLHEWLQELQELVNTSTDEVLKDDACSLAYSYELTGVDVQQVHRLSFYVPVTCLLLEAVRVTPCTF